MSEPTWEDLAMEVREPFFVKVKITDGNFSAWWCSDAIHCSLVDWWCAIAPGGIESEIRSTDWAIENGRTVVTVTMLAPDIETLRRDIALLQG